MSLKQAHYSGYENNERKRKTGLAIVCIFALLVVAFTSYKIISHYAKLSSATRITSLALELEIPTYTGELVVEVNNNVPFFLESELTIKAFEQYSPLDALKRCGTAFACLSRDTMPKEERDSIGAVKPSGWHTVRYDNLIEDKYLYNRCHLIAYSLAGENANELNLITGTRHMNISGMLPYENEVAEYIEQTGNHVLYRVTPFFEDDNLVATGVLMEAQSIEDSGLGVMFNVFVFNIQPGIVIDYSNGDSYAE